MARDIAEATPLVAQTVDRFLADRCRPTDWVRVAASQHGWSRDNWREMAELGWLGICLPESAGGLGCGIEERIAVMEGVGRGLVLEPYMSTAVLCAELVQAAGGQAQHPALLPAIAAGEQVMAFAATEPGARFETLPIACTAVRESGGGWRLDGQKIAVLDAPGAATLVVLARTAGAACDRSGLSLFLVEPTAAGITLRVHSTVDRRRCADIAFDAVHLPADALLGAEGQAWDAVSHAVDHAIIATCAEAVGAMAAVIGMTIIHLKERQQFGKPLASFQVLRHRVADMHIACEQARSLTTSAAASLVSDHPRRSLDASAAKAQAAAAARFVGQQAVQLHGGMGMSDEMRVGHYFKRLIACELLFGNADHHLRRFGELGAALDTAVTLS
jgi:alkylation response protein AidB-like acyl-CoA dehydrogenase